MRQFLLLSVLGLAACDRLLEPWRNDDSPPGSYQMASVPDSFPAYWQQIDRCSGIVRPMTVTFYQIDSVAYMVWRVGEYQAVPDRITLGTYALAHPRSIRHEMLHAHLRELTLRANTSEQHPKEYGVKCAELIEGWR